MEELSSGAIDSARADDLVEVPLLAGQRQRRTHTGQAKEHRRERIQNTVARSTSDMTPLDPLPHSLSAKMTQQQHAREARDQSAHPLIGRSGKCRRPLSVGLSRLPGMRTSGLVSLLLGGGPNGSTLAEPRVTIERDA
jgi:hypothetical protein